MNSKRVTYLGLDLKNPIIVSSCGLTSNVNSIKKLEQNGAAAVVLKSLFEEQILGEIYHTSLYNEMPEMESYVNAYVKENSINNYIELIRGAKSQCTIPVIASLCCLQGGQWSDFAKEIEKAGADALELNIFYMPTSKEQKSEEIENRYLETVSEIIKSVSIPVSVKIPNHFTNTIRMVNELYFRGAKGVVMFNRFFEPDIDLKHTNIVSSTIYSRNEELRFALRWIGIASSEVKTVSYAASTGVHTGEDVVKMLLVGASAVQVCSALYLNGMETISKMLKEIDQYMSDHHVKQISDIVGKLNYSNTDHGVAFERSQFMKYFSSHKG